MKAKLKCFLCGVLALVLAAGLLACEKKPSGAHEYDHAADFRPEEGELFSDVPTGSYDEYTFTILNARTGSAASGMDTDALEGDSLNEALYRRNDNVEERLNIQIEEERDTPEKVHRIAVASCLADEDKYAAVWNSASFMAQMAAAGYLVTDEYLLEVDLTKPWWKPEVMDAAAVDGARFLFFGDLNLSFYDAHSMVGVNMSLLGNFTGLPDPYILADSGNWTLDVMLSLMDAVDGDVDGNGILTYEDLYGTALTTADALPLLYGCGVRMSTPGDDGAPTLSCINDENFYGAFITVAEQLYANNPYVYDVEKNEADNMQSLDMFLSRHTLFYLTNVGGLSRLRDMEDEFGVLPMPKGADHQTKYRSYLSGDISALGIMVTGRNLLRTGVILENLAAESYRPGGLREKYAESVLPFKYINDEKSRENLLRILDSGVVDPAAIYNWGGVTDTLTDLWHTPGMYASRMNGIRRAAWEDILATRDAMAKYR